MISQIGINSIILDRIAFGGVKELQLDFGHSGIDPLQIRQERAGAVQKLYEVWSEGRHHEIP
jgi:hypothetical protein